jgi:ATP-binding cassette subfamily B protein
VKEFCFTDEKAVIAEPDSPVRLNDVKGKIEFENVWFAYNDEDYVLKEVSFKIEAGEKVAFVGATGAGKSTIINLLSRFYEVNKGKITIDGIDIKDIPQRELRKYIGIVLQDVFLFSGDIRSNITLNNRQINEDSINNAVDNVRTAKLC